MGQRTLHHVQRSLHHVAEDAGGNARNEGDFECAEEEVSEWRVLGCSNTAVAQIFLLFLADSCDAAAKNMLRTSRESVVALGMACLFEVLRHLLVECELVWSICGLFDGLKVV
ncbi:MAG: hypothetical protein GY938_07375 [Ketobacter sp.]|nr:hypothetical protein [Ketobacter sp.]